MMRYSRPMSWAVGRTWLIGGRRSTRRRPAASVTLKVRLERPPAMSSNVSGASTPSTWSASHAVTGAALIPSIIRVILPSRSSARAEAGQEAAHAAQPPFPGVGPPALVRGHLRMGKDQEALVGHGLDDRRRHLVRREHNVHAGMRRAHSVRLR